MKDHVEVCPLSRRTMRPVSQSLQLGIRFFHIPIPALPTVFLTVHLPLPAAIRAYPVPHVFPSGADPSFTPVVICPRVVIGKDLHLTTHLLVQAYQHLWLVWDDDACQRFTYVGRIRSSLAPLRLGVSRIRLTSRFDAPSKSEGTLSLKLHTTPLPASHVQVGNGWWNNRFHQFISPPVKQKSMRLAGRTAEIPLLCLARLVHLGITRLVGVLGGAGRPDDGGVHDGSGLHLETTALQDRADLGKQGLAQLVVIEQAAKLEHRGGIGHRASGTGSAPRSMPTKRRRLVLSYSASSQARSARLNQCWMK